MSRTITPFISTTALVLISVLPAPAYQDDSVAPLSRFDTIFVAEVERAQPADGCENDNHRFGWSVVCQRVHVLVLQIIKRPEMLRSAPLEFDTKVLAKSAGISGQGWSPEQLRPARQYLILSTAKRGLPEAFGTPSRWWPVTDTDDVVRDVELVTNMSRAGVGLQSATVVSSIQNTSKPHSPFLTEYVAWLLMNGTESDTTALAHAIESAEPLGFSDAAKHALLFYLWNGARSPEVPGNALHVFVTMAVRYLVEAPDQPRLDTVDLRANILRNYVPSILASERNREALRSALSPALREQLQAKAAVLGRNSAMPSDQRVHLEELVGMLVRRGTEGPPR